METKYSINEIKESFKKCFEYEMTDLEGNDEKYRLNEEEFLTELKTLHSINTINNKHLTMGIVVIETKVTVRREFVRNVIHAHIVGLHELLFYSGNRGYSKNLDESVALISHAYMSLSKERNSENVTVYLRSILKTEKMLVHSLFDGAPVSITENI